MEEEDIKKEKILLVDDTPSVINMIKTALSNEMYHIIVATSGEKAVKQAESQIPDLILLDILMPGMNGYETCRHLKANEKTREIPVIFMSALADTYDKVKGIRLGAVDYIAKPLEPEELLVRISTHLTVSRLQKELKTHADALKASNQRLKKEVEERGRTEQALQKAHDDLKLMNRELEDRVRERTSAFENANRELRNEIEEHRKSEEERRKLESRLHQAQKMEAIGTLAGGIAHDFNNILCPIIWYTEMTLAKIPGDSDAERYLKMVLMAARRATDLIKQILAFSREGDQEFRPLKIQFILKESLKLLRATIPTTIEIHQNIGRECGPVAGDPTQIYQVVMNLCTNAYHAMEKTGGILDISLKEIDIDPDDFPGKTEMRKGKYLQLSVSDTGHGIEPSLMKRIFDPYFTTKEAGKGTGLGLSVVCGIVEKHKGEIKAYSEPEKGTTFHIYLPRVELDSRKTEHFSELAPGNGEHILLADDEEVIANVETCMLKSLGYRVTTFTDSLQALEAFRTQPDNFDLVLTDMTMPKMTGAELAEEMMRIRPDLPIILCTGFSGQMDQEKAKAMGIREYLAKPVTKGELTQKIRKALEGEEE